MSTSIPPQQQPPQPAQPIPAPIPSTDPHHLAEPQHTVPATNQELIIYSHSNFFYWWPVWLVGFLLALLTSIHGVQVQVGNNEELFLVSKNAGVIYAVTLFLVIMITNVSLRGVGSVVLILVVLVVTLALAYWDLWRPILSVMPHISVYMNMGFYLLFSSLIFLVWAGSVFVYDRLSYWKIRPGQITHEFVIGGAEKSYDTRGMVFEKFRNDLFRHWMLGFGSADLHISTMGAKREQLTVPNVLFANAKVQAIQQMIAIQPDQFTSPANP